MKKYSGFTLIEMLIVMGIIIILMAAGIAGGRFALQRANRIQKQSAVDNIEQALWGYYSDYRKYPDATSPANLLGSGGDLAEYIDAGQFDGGADGTFYYFVSAIGQEFAVCTSLGGFGDEQGFGIYCAGNGMDTGDLVEGGNVIFQEPIPTDNIYDSDNASGDYVRIQGSGNSSNWYGENRSWSAP